MCMCARVCVGGFKSPPMFDVFGIACFFFSGGWVGDLYTGYRHGRGRIIQPTGSSIEYAAPTCLKATTLDNRKWAFALAELQDNYCLKQ